MLNVVPFLVFIAQRSYLQAAGVTRPIVVATAVGIGGERGRQLALHLSARARRRRLGHRLDAGGDGDGGW